MVHPVPELIHQFPLSIVALILIVVATSAFASVDVGALVTLVATFSFAITDPNAVNKSVADKNIIFFMAITQSNTARFLGKR